jgi:hypothetical protein
MTAGRYHHIPLAVPRISHGIGDAGRRQPALPEFNSGFGVEGAQVGVQRAGENQAARRDKG